jgi:hypothetical protein
VTLKINQYSSFGHKLISPACVYPSVKVRPVKVIVRTCKYVAHIDANIETTQNSVHMCRVFPACWYDILENAHIRRLHANQSLCEFSQNGEKPSGQYITYRMD